MNRVVSLAAAFAALISLAGCSKSANSALLDPAAWNEQAPAQFKAKFETTKGAFVIGVNREWAPLGADRFYNLVKSGYYDHNRFFRVVDGFVAQFGISGEPDVNAAWETAKIADDPVRQSNRRGMVTFATSGPNTRTTQLFINLADNPNLDSMGFSPFGQVVEGMEVVDRLYSGYGEGAPRGGGPDQQMITNMGNRYLEEQFPQLDYIQTASIVP